MSTEESIWKGSPSQWTNFVYYIVCIPLSFFVIGIVMGIWRFLTTKFTIIEVTTERIIEEKGVLSKTTNELELFRVKDIVLEQPFWLRILSLSNVVLSTTDRSHKTFTIGGVPNGK